MLIIQNIIFSIIISPGIITKTIIIMIMVMVMVMVINENDNGNGNGSGNGNDNDNDNNNSMMMMVNVCSNINNTESTLLFFLFLSHDIIIRMLR